MYIFNSLKTYFLNSKEAPVHSKYPYLPYLHMCPLYRLLLLILKNELIFFNYPQKLLLRFLFVY
jgi:hypothetical protein